MIQVVRRHARAWAAVAVLASWLASTVPGHASEKVLYSFKTGADAQFPAATLTADASGALYGTAEGGGTAELGAVFKLTPPAPGAQAWSETGLYSFQGLQASDGAVPAGQLLVDGAGALYGTTEFGGLSNNGTVFRLTPPGPGQTRWT